MGEDPRQQPSELLCEVGLDLATRLNAYEAAGGTSHVDDVITSPDFVDLFDRSESAIGKPRPQWRWEVRLRQGQDVETVVGHANGAWTVEGIDVLTRAAPLDGPCVVVIEPHGAELDFKPPAVDAGTDAEAVSSGVPMLGPFALLHPLVALGIRKTVAHRPPSWHADPAARHRYRYWNGARWTRFVLETNVAAPPSYESLSWKNRLRFPKV